MSPPRTDTPTRVGRWIALLFVVGGLSVAAIGPRLERQTALAALEERARAPRRVSVAKAQRAPAEIELTLPGGTRPFAETRLYARATGFLRKLNADMGDQVKEGQVLAELAAPETEQELRRARAQLGESKRNVALALQSARRQDGLAAQGVSAQQLADDARTRANSVEGEVGVRSAEVARLGALVNYLRIVAPFDGVITRRHVDRGALVRPGDGAGLFEIARTDRLRVFVDVPQTYAEHVRVGETVRVQGRGVKAPVAEGKIVRTAGALELRSRTLRVEIHLPAGQGLLAGSFVNVTFRLRRAEPPVLVPAAALSIASEGPTVSVVEPGAASVPRAVKILPVKLGWDRGREVEIVAGLEPGGEVIVNRPDNLTAGEKVMAVPLPPAAAK